MSRGCFFAFAIVVGVLALVVLVYALFTFTVGIPPQWMAKVAVCDQPSSVTYADGTYEVVVREETGSLALGGIRSYAMVGQVGADGTYGVPVELNAGSAADQVTCRWEADRVEVVEPNGIVHTVPAEVFVGGR